MIDPVWNEVMERGWGKYPNESLVRFLCRYKRTHDMPARILDAGCGGGANTKMMIAEGFDVYALDGTSKGVEMTREFTGLDDTHLRVCDFSQLGTCFHTQFDLVVDNVSFGYVGTVDDFMSTLRQARDLLKPGGLLWSCEFGDETVGVFPAANHLFTEETIRERYGLYFKVNRVETHKYTDDGRVVSLLEVIAEKV